MLWILDWKLSGCSAGPVRTNKSSSVSAISHPYTQRVQLVLDPMYSFRSQIISINLKTSDQRLFSQWEVVWPVPVESRLCHYLPVWCPFSLLIALIAETESFVCQHVWQKVGSKYIFIATAWAFVICSTLNIYWPMLHLRDSTASFMLWPFLRTTVNKPFFKKGVFQMLRVFIWNGQNEEKLMILMQPVYQPGKP